MPPMVGQISFFPYVFPPAGWMFCHGQLMSIAEHDTLFFLMGTRFGGDGESTFALPDLRAAAPPNTNYCISIFGLFKPRSYEGVAGETFLSFDAPSAENLLECTGQPVARNKYAMLDSLMGTRFGGGANINLPDLRTKAPAKFRYLMTMTGDEPSLPRERAPLVGELFLLPYETSSEWFMLCDGRRVQIKQNTALYSLLGDQFGGDNTNFFCVPDLRSVAPAKYNYYICVHGVFPSRP